MKKLKAIFIMGMILIFTAGCSLVDDKNIDLEPSIDNSESSTNSDQSNTKDSDTQEESEEESEKESEKENSDTQKEPEKESEKEIPDTQKEPEKEITDTPSSTPSTEESAQQRDYIKIIEQAVNKTISVDSVYYTRYRTGIYPEDAKIKYNKSQNRFWYSTQKIEEYLEGFPGRYTTEFNPVKYFYQTWWLKNEETGLWERQGSIHSTFGISELAYLKQIKSVEKLDVRRCPYDVYVVTLSQAFANEASADILNTTDMFSKDVTLTVMVDHEGYIRSIDCDWQKDVLNKPSIGPVTISIRIGEFNQTKIVRPSDLKDEPVDYPDSRDELTPNKKEAIKDIIYTAYKKTYDAQNATYIRNGKTVTYDISMNLAFMKDTDGTVTYYEGNAGKYADYDMVTSDYQQESWTKLQDSDIWSKNVKKHTCFIPRELYFLKTIFDVSKVEVGKNQTTYTIEVLKQYANSAYSYAYDMRSYSYESSKTFNNNIIFTVSIDNEGYVREIHIDSEGYKLDLSIDNINTTTVEKPTDI